MKKLPIIAILYPTKAELDAAREKRSRASCFGFFSTTSQTQVLTDADLDAFAKEIAEREVAPSYGKLEHAFNADGKFIWLTHRGEQYLLEEMATPHLFYSLRMLFNHSVPPVFRVVGPGETMRRYKDVSRWDADYRTEALRQLRIELGKRDDLEGNLQEQLDDIEANSRVIVALGV